MEICPKCAIPSVTCCDKRVVTIKDTPIRDKQVFLKIIKRRFYCKSCNKPFTEPVQGIVKGRKSTVRFRKHILWCATNEQINVSVGVGVSEVYLQNLGLWSVECDGVTSLGLTSSASSSIEVINELPVADFNIQAQDETSRKYLANISANDPDGYIIRSVLQMTTPSNNQYSYEVGDSIPLTLSEAGIYTFSLTVQDSDGVWSESVSKNFEVVNKLPVADFSITKISADRFFFVVQNSSDPDGDIIEYNFSFNGPKGETLSNNSSSNFEIQLASAGSWNISLVVKDNDGDFSEPVVKNILIENELPSASFLVELRADEKGADIAVAAANDPEGSLLSYIVNATAPDGEKESYEFSANNYSLDLVKPGQWSLELLAKDSDGGLSSPSIFTLDIEDAAPIALFEVIKNGEMYSLDASASTDDSEIAEYKFSITSPSGVISNASQKIVSNLSLDADGVRDDVERFIEENIDESVKENMKVISKSLGTRNNNDLPESEHLNELYKEIDSIYCMKSKIDENVVNELVNEVKVKFYNTQERLEKWADTQSKLSGVSIPIEFQKSNFRDYCN